MEILNIKKKKNGEYQITLSNQMVLSIYAETIIKYNLLANKKFDEKYWQEIINFNNEYKAYYEAIKYLNAKLRTKKEIVAKLEKNGYLKSTIANVIAKLEQQNYINDELYIKSFIADQINLALNGPQKIKRTLQNLGFNMNLITQYLEEYSDDLWEEKIRKIINKKIKANHNLSKISLINKIKINLLNLGYSQDLINKGLQDIEIVDDYNALEKEYQKELRKLSRKYKDKELETKLKYNLYKKGFSLEKIERVMYNE